MSNEIIGYEVPFDLWRGEVKKGEIYVKPKDYDGRNYSYSKDQEDYYFMPSELVESWKPVYKSELSKITRFVLSYCSIPKEILETLPWSEEYPPDCFTEYNITSKEEQSKFDDDFALDNWILEKYPELEGETIFIKIDY